VLRGAMAAIVASLLLCAIPGGLFWLLPWRLLAGLAGGALMSLAGPAVQRAVEPERRGAASGIVIAGVGGGAALGALVLPPLLLGGPVPAGWASRRWPPRSGASRIAAFPRMRGRPATGTPPAAGCCWPMRCPGRGWWRRWSICQTSRRAASASGCWRAAGRG
jgi:MFS family permease